MDIFNSDLLETFETNAFNASFNDITLLGRFIKLMHSMPISKPMHSNAVSDWHDFLVGLPSFILSLGMILDLPLLGITSLQ
jgi:hypothetical protein